MSLIAFTNAVKNCLEARRSGVSSNRVDGSTQLAELVHETKQLSVKDPVEALIELQLNESSKTGGPVAQITSAGKTYPECLLQYVDILRLKALVYRDVVRNDRNKVKPYVVVVTINFMLFV